MGSSTLKPRAIVAELKEFILTHMSEEINLVKLEVFQLVLDEINRHDQLLIDEVESKKIKDEKIFDIFHNSFERLHEEGYVEYTTDFHEWLSEFSKGNIDSKQVFDKLTSDEKDMVLTQLFTKDFNEQMVAHRHGFQYITKTTGHDGIDKDNNVYEAKSRRYTVKSRNIAPNIPFSGPSSNVLRKLTEGRPLFILNIMEDHKLICELTVECSDEVLESFKKRLESGVANIVFTFSEYKPFIREITFIRDDIDQYEKLHTGLKELLIK